MFSKILAISIFLFQLSFLLAPWLAVFGLIEARVALLLMSGKALAEYSFFRSVVRKLHLPFSWLAFLVLQFIYPYYVVAVGLLANRGTYAWKGRTF